MLSKNLLLHYIIPCVIIQFILVVLRWNYYPEEQQFK